MCPAKFWANILQNNLNFTVWQLDELDCEALPVLLWPRLRCRGLSASMRSLNLQLDFDTCNSLQVVTITRVNVNYTIQDIYSQGRMNLCMLYTQHLARDSFLADSSSLVLVGG